MLVFSGCCARGSGLGWEIKNGNIANILQDTRETGRETGIVRRD